jgi:hypothetical protein
MKYVYFVKKGFVLSYFLIYFCIASALYLFAMSFLQLKMTWLQSYQLRTEKLLLETKIINRIEYEYTEYLEENFQEVWDENTVAVEYDDMIATIIVNGKFNFKAELIFDDICVCILEYNYLNEE